MTAPSNANTSGLAQDLCERLDAILVEESPMHPFGCSTWEEASRIAIDMAKEVIVTAASAQARIAELEAERDQIAGESIWWKAVIGDGEYTPSGEVPSIKHLHPATVKPIFEAHKGSAVADVIAGLIFSRAITENREQFLVGQANDRATAAEARANRLAEALEDLEGVTDSFCDCSADFLAGQILIRIRAALQQETQP